MNGGEALDLAREATWVLIVMAGPVMIIGLLVGVAIGILQALTQIQEMTLTFVPKMAAIVGVFWISMGFMTETLVGFFRDTLMPVIAGG